VSGEAIGDVPDQARELLTLYDDALGEVYGYLRRRCGSDAVAEDLTSETFMAAVGEVRRRRVDSVTTAWLIGIARHKLVDHWRRVEREQRNLALVDADGIDGSDDHWDVTLDALDATATLQELAPQHRLALTLRYLDGLPQAEVARHLNRTEGATEVLLVRARRAFRARYGTNRGEEQR
jgi:RNA polymerase sigma-70 factor, ECF subfamily